MSWILRTTVSLTILALNQGDQGWQNVINDLEERTEAIAQNSVQKMVIGHQPLSVSPSKEGEEGQRQVIWANSVRVQALMGDLEWRLLVT